MEKKKEDIRELKRRLNDSIIRNSDLKTKLQRSENQNSILDRNCQEIHCRLENTKATMIEHSAKLEETSKKNHDLYAEYKRQEQEIEFLKSTNIRIDTELKTRVTQLNKFTGEIARQTQRVNTSAIRDDEYFRREFAGLAKEMRDWSFQHFPSHPGTQDLTSGLWGEIREIAGGTYLQEISKNRSADRRLVCGLLANRLKKEFFEPFLLGLLSKEFAEFEHVIEKTGKKIGPPPGGYKANLTKVSKRASGYRKR